MTLTKRGLPSAVEVDGRLFPIRTDFQYAVLFSERLKDPEARPEDFDFMYAGRIPRSRAAGLRALHAFVFPSEELPRGDGAEGGEILLDYGKDARLIYAAFYERYGIDLFAPELHLHWHKFRALLFGLKGTKLNDVMGFRSYTPDAKDSPAYRRSMAGLKRQWRIEPELTAAERQALAAFDARLKG